MLVLQLTNEQPSTGKTFATGIARLKEWTMAENEHALTAYLQISPCSVKKFCINGCTSLQSNNMSTANQGQDCGNSGAFVCAANTHTGEANAPMVIFLGTCTPCALPPQTHVTLRSRIGSSQLQVFGYGSGRATGCRPIAATWFIVIVAVGTTNLFPAYGHGQTKNRSACAQRRNSTNIVRGLTKVVHDRQFP